MFSNIDCYLISRKKKQFIISRPKCFRSLETFLEEKEAINLYLQLLLITVSYPITFSSSAENIFEENFKKCFTKVLRMYFNKTEFLCLLICFEKKKIAIFSLYTAIKYYIYWIWMKTILKERRKN